MTKPVIQARADVEYAPVAPGQVGDIARRLGLFVCFGRCMPATSTIR